MINIKFLNKEKDEINFENKVRIDLDDEIVIILHNSSDKIEKVAISIDGLSVLDGIEAECNNVSFYEIPAYETKYITKWVNGEYLKFTQGESDYGLYHLENPTNRGIISFYDGNEIKDFYYRRKDKQRGFKKC